MILSALQYVFRPIFGEFEKEEFKKFLRLGTIFALILGSYWTLRVLKDDIFIELAGKANIPWAKTASLIILFPLVMVYTRLLDMYSREKMFYVLSSIYATGALIFGTLLYKFQVSGDAMANLSATEGLLTQVLGYVIYIFVESYGSLVVALFWAFSADITESASARKGFYLVTALGQIGGIVGPLFITKLPKYFGQETSSLPLYACTVSIVMVAVFLTRFLKKTPAHLLKSFQGKNEAAVEKEQEPGFLEGLKLLLSHKYLMAIFTAIASYEIIVTIFDFNFKYLAATHYAGRDLGVYLGQYGSMVNVVSLICLLAGVSNITRYLGVGVALALMPIIVGGAITGFLTIDSLNFLFWLMVGSKAINYALNGPALKQLYIPTTHDVRFKSQAWIETFGSRGSKEAGSLFNLTKALPAFPYMMAAGILGYGLVIGWFFVALYLGRTYAKATDEKRVIC